jgi:tetratricopeptide (TPR) repeat protein
VGVESETTTTRPLLRWAPAAAIAASVVLVVSVALWMRPTLQSNSPLATRVSAPSPAQVPEKPRREPPPSLEQLARVDPPRYEPVTSRNVPDEATKRFQRGMEHYRQADYAGAVEHLRAAMSLDPLAPHIYFFLGISELMLGKDKDAIVQLSRTIALGDSAYLEEAHWYLAKAFLRQKDLDAAKTQLKTVIQLRGAKSGEAQRLLTQLESSLWFIER